MKPEIKKLWVDALRSGQYKQGQTYLKRNNEYCCLGVLCDLHNKEMGVGWDVSGDDTIYSYLGRVGLLPDKVREWSELEKIEVKIDEDCDASLIGLNDTGYSFSQIADLIEAQL